MSQKPVNLNRFRKSKARADEKARADQNAAFHGLTKAQKAAARAEAERAATAQAAKQRDPK